MLHYFHVCLKVSQKISLDITIALGEYPGYESPSAGFELSDNSNRD